MEQIVYKKTHQMGIWTNQLKTEKVALKKKIARARCLMLSTRSKLKVQLTKLQLTISLHLRMASKKSYVSRLNKEAIRALKLFLKLTQK